MPGGDAGFDDAKLAGAEMMFCGVRQGWRGFVMWLVAVLAVGFCGACGQKYNNNQSVGSMDEPDVQEPEPDVSVEPDVGPDDVGNREGEPAQRSQRAGFNLQ